MKYLSVTCTVAEDGRIPAHLGEKIRDLFRQLVGHELQIIIQKPKRYSTNPQRQYYYAVIVEGFQRYFAAQGTYYKIDDIHDSLMKEIGKLWNETPDPLTGRITAKRKSYMDLSTVEVENYHTLCRAEAASRGFDLPEPNEYKAPKIERKKAAIAAPVIENEPVDPVDRIRHLIDHEDEIPT